MTTYLAVYEGKQVSVTTDKGVYIAKLEAVGKLQAGSRKKVRAHMVTIMPVESGGETITHRADF